MKPSNAFCISFLKASGWLDNHDKQIKTDTINGCIKTLAESEDTVLSDKQYYTLMELKEQEK